jgi:AcrR family transcriptional regulator
MAEALRSPSRPMAGAGAIADRVLDAALTCIARFGVAKTTVDDVAREAGLSRATVYRTFPGKQPLLDAVVAREVGRFEQVLFDAAATASALGDVVVALLVAGARHLEGHAALTTVLAHERDLLLPALTFDGAGATLARAGRVLAPLLEPYVGAARAARAGEWVARTALAYLCAPTASVLLTDPDSVRELVDDFVVPGLVGAASPTRG